jgi:predicted PurR-regulated permease PerM
MRETKRSVRGDAQAIEPIPAGPDAYEISAWILTGLALALVFPLHLFSALMSGLLVYELVQSVAPLLRITRIGHKRAKMVVVGLLAGLIVAVLVVICWKTAVFLRGEDGNIQALLKKMAEILDSIRSRLPDWAVENLPENIEDINGSVADMLREHAAGLQQAGKGIGLTMAHVLVGMVLGAIVSLNTGVGSGGRPPFGRALVERARRISQAFRSVVFAQVRISALNTVLTFLYLMVALPAAGTRLPLAKTMVAVTFLVGLLPVVGNLISNSVIVLVSLSFSFPVAVWSLAFLVVIHKLEYFLNARIVGGRIHARTWELLLAMLVMESAFGLPGLVAAPIYYAYVKRELSDRGLV